MKKSRSRSNLLVPELAVTSYSPLDMTDHAIKPEFRHSSTTTDDEDVEISGDSSGSGDGSDAEDDVTSFTSQNATVTSRSDGQESETVATTDMSQELVVGGEVVFACYMLS